MRKIGAGGGLGLRRRQLGAGRLGLGFHLIQAGLGVDAVLVEILCAGKIRIGPGRLGRRRRRLGVEGAGLKPYTIIANEGDHLAALDGVAFLDLQLHQGSGNARPGVRLVPGRIFAGNGAKVGDGPWLDGQALARGGRCDGGALVRLGGASRPQGDDRQGADRQGADQQGDCR